MKKLVSMLLVMVMVFSLVACGNSQSSNKSGSSASNKSDSSAANTSTGYTGGEYKITLGFISSESSNMYAAASKFKEYVETESGGKITVDILCNGVLGGDEAMLEAVALGTLTMTIPSASVLTVYDRSFGVLAMPYLFTSVDDAFAAVDGELGQLLNQRLLDANAALQVLGYNFNGIRNMTNNIRPVEKVEDLSGLKMRCMNSDVFINMFKLMGANPTPMSWSELFTGLQQGTVDGQENPAALMYNSKFYEVQKYVSITEHVYDFCAVVASDTFYDGLDDQAKAIISTGLSEYLVKYQRELEVSKNEEYIQKLEDAGMELARITDEEKIRFAEAVAPMYETADEDFGADIMAAVKKYN